jgi:exopolysaccharide biosynthesis polyprenyl glycosylphosphotransferase
VSTLPEVLHERVRAALDPLTLDLVDSPRAHRRGWLVRRALLAADLLGITLAFLLAQRLYGRHVAGDRFAFVEQYVLLALSLPLWVVVAKLYGLYDRDEERADHSTADDVVGVFHLVTVGTWLLFAGAELTQVAQPTFTKLFVFWVLAVGLIPLLRSGARGYCRRQVEYLQNTLVIGTDEAARSVARKVLHHPEYGLNLVGFVGDDDYDEPELSHLAVLGGLEDVPALVRMLDVERVIVGFADEPYQRLVELVRMLNSFEVQVDVVPRLHDVLSPAVDVHTVEGVPLIGLRPPELASSSKLLKRCLDVVGASIGLLLLAPLFFVAAAAIVYTSEGPVFFRQVRMGRNGQPFRIFKFRTMVADAEERKRSVAHLNVHALPGRDPRMFKIDDDPRVTAVGRVLRRFSLDELPQLLNVLRGEMSLVGPRPLILEEHAHVTAWASRRLSLRPGMTGLWQVLGRSGISFDDMVKLDYVYVTTWSLWNDCRLLLRTLPVVVKGDARGY